MLVVENRERGAIEGEMNNSSLNVGLAWAFGDTQFRKLCALISSSDVLLQSNDVDRESEGNCKGGSSVIRARRWIIRIVRGEHELQLVEINGLDDVELASVRENRLDLQALDPFVQPAYTGGPCAIADNSDIAVLAVNERVENG